MDEPPGAMGKLVCPYRVATDHGSAALTHATLDLTRNNALRLDLHAQRLEELGQKRALRRPRRSGHQLAYPPTLTRQAALTRLPKCFSTAALNRGIPQSWIKYFSRDLDRSDRSP